MQKAKKVVKQKVYVGIADCHGIESFIPEEKANVGILQVRASANIQRHAVVFKVTCNEAEASQIEKILAHGERNDFVIALRKIKSWASDEYARLCGANGVESPLVEVTNAKLWKNIPNHKLDPFN